MRSETHAIFHKLWTKAVGTPEYNKKEWMELEQEIQNESQMDFNYSDVDKMARPASKFENEEDNLKRI